MSHRPRKRFGQDFSPLTFPAYFNLLHVSRTPYAPTKLKTFRLWKWMQTGYVIRGSGYMFRVLSLHVVYVYPCVLWRIGNRVAPDRMLKHLLSF